MVESHVVQTIGTHATHVTTTIERTEVRGVFDIVSGVATLSIHEDDIGLHLHLAALHIFLELVGFGQVHLTEVIALITNRNRFLQSLQHFGRNHVGAITTQEHILNPGIGTNLQLGCRRTAR